MAVASICSCLPLWSLCFVSLGDTDWSACRCDLRRSVSSWFTFGFEVPPCPVLIKFLLSRALTICSASLVLWSMCLVAFALADGLIDDLRLPVGARCSLCSSLGDEAGLFILRVNCAWNMCFYDWTFSLLTFSEYSFYCSRSLSLSAY